VIVEFSFFPFNLTSPIWLWDILVMIFTLFTHFFLSSKRPNTCSNHDMVLSYLIFSFHTSRSHEEELGKQIVLEY